MAAAAAAVAAKSDTKAAPTAPAATAVDAKATTPLVVNAASVASKTDVSGFRIDPSVRALEQQLLVWRRHLHAHPETSFKEFETAKYVAAQLRAISPALKVYENIGQTGVVAVLQGGAGPGPCVALRCDMDGLPIQEQPSALNGAYISRNAGAMHACGHDGHMSIMLGAVHVLVARAATMRGSVKFLFQPAEEGFAGAAAMLRDGVLDDGPCGPKVDGGVYGLHLWNYMNTGQCGIKTGPLMAASDRFNIAIAGKGGHGAVPQGTTDCIVAGANLVLQLHTLVARNVNPLDSAVLTVGQFNAGYAPNVIADAVALTGTVRTFHPDTRRLLIERMQTVCDGVARSFAVRVTLEYVEGYPCTSNTDKAGVDHVLAAATRVVPDSAAGRDAFLVKPESTMGAEDVSFLLRAAGKGCFFFLGCSLNALSSPLCSSAHVDGPCSSSVTTGEERPHHRSDFDFDERVLAIGASLWTTLIGDLLGSTNTAASADTKAGGAVAAASTAAAPAPAPAAAPAATTAPSSAAAAAAK